MEVICKKKGHTLIASLCGELDHHNAVSVREDLDRHLSAVGIRNLIFDLSALRFMDSSGLGIIIGRYKTISALGGQTRIASPSEPAKRLIALSGIHKIISVYDSVEDAAKEL